MFEVDTDGSTATTSDDSLSQFVRIVDNGDGNVDELQIDADGGGDNYAFTAAIFDAGSMVRMVFQDDGAESTANVSV
ncbi:MAG: hypothetical protein MPJ78_05530 [Hyphomicrobiaceae bacterium]|nr:hypothetical protein [Hyphomicrobiaceae bacterium]